MPRLTHIYRHPIKAIGVEALDRATLQPDQTLEGDRLWAVMHEASGFDPAEGWGRCANFVRGASSAQLMAIKAETLPDGRIALRHPAHAPLTIAPTDPDDAARLIAWLRPICNPDRAAPARLVAATRQGMTDAPDPYISILTAASLQALSAAAGVALARERFRGNLWLDGTDPWQEFDWIGRRIQVGNAILEVAERITRCDATKVNPETGTADADTLGALETNWDHRNFGVYARVIKGGEVSLGDEAILP